LRSTSTLSHHLKKLREADQRRLRETARVVKAGGLARGRAIIRARKPGA